MDSDIKSIIKSGFKIPFHRRPPLAHHPRHDPVMSDKEKEILDQEVSDLLRKGSIEPTTSPGFSSRLFCIPKKTGDLRPVLNLRKLNEYVVPQSPARCISSCVNPQRITKVSTVSLEGKAISISSASLRTIPSSTSVHKSITTFATVGTQTRDTDISLPGRPDHSRQEQGTVDTTHGSSTSETPEIGVSGKIIQVTSNSNPEIRSLRIHNRHQDHVTPGTWQEDSGHPQGSQSDGPERDSNTPPAVFLHWNGAVNDRSSLSGQTEDSQPAHVEKRLNKIGNELDRLNLAVRGSSPGPNMVAYQPTVLERLDLDSPEDGSGSLHGCIRLRLGDCHGGSFVVRPMATTSQGSSHQPERTADGPDSNQAQAMSGQNGQHHFRQHDNDCLHQSVRRNPITRVDADGDAIMELLPEDEHTDQDNIHSVSFQPSGLSVSSTHFSARVVHQSILLLTAGETMGPPQSGPIRLRSKSPTPTVHELETLPNSIGDGRTTPIVGETGQRLLLPTLESDTSNPGEDSPGESDSDADHTTLAISNLVSSGQADGDGSTDSNSSPGGHASSRKRPEYLGEESALVSKCLENKRQRLRLKGFDDNALSIAVGNPAEVRKLEAYAKIHRRYIAWALLRDIDPNTPSPAHLANWLASGMVLHKWKPSTADSYRKAIQQMYPDKSIFAQDEDFQDFIKQMKQGQLKVLRDMEVNLDPIVAFFSRQDDLSTLDIKPLTQRLCWMLTVVGMLHPDSIRCIDISDTRFRITDDIVIIPILRPKETRAGQPISWSLTIQRHENPLLCPVATFAAYLTRIKDSACVVKHPKNPNTQYTPLIRDCRDFTVPVGSDTISNHAQVIANLVPRQPGTSRTRGRATGATAAFQGGAPVADIVAHANWSSSILFDKYYRLGSRTKTNLTTTILRSPA
ncbi:hypothetical protein BGZ46_001946 [Entomortierella lignicola]|nr:hypothetical protein BGZ46_001946 [Entomortierella lignicola]